MKLAAAAYKMDVLESWEAYAAKLTAWVEDAAGQGADERSAQHLPSTPILP